MAPWPALVFGVVQSVPVAQGANEIENAPTHFHVLDPHEGQAQLQPFTACKEFHHRWRLPGFGETARRSVGVSILVEEADGNAEDTGHLEQPAGSDPIDPLLVFLDLLEGQTQQLAQTLLTNTVKNNTHSYAVSDK